MRHASPPFRDDEAVNSSASNSIRAADAGTYPQKLGFLIELCRGWHPAHSPRSGFPSGAVNGPDTDVCERSLDV